MSVSAKERVLAALGKESVDRPPVSIFTQSATLSQMDRLGIRWPEANYDAEKMAMLGAGQIHYGFESIRVPFCMTVEAERLGCGIKQGTDRSTPSVCNPIGKDAERWDDFFRNLPSSDEFTSSGRTSTVINAVRIASKKHGESYPVIAGSLGPFTLTCQLIGIENTILGTLMRPDDVKKTTKTLLPLLEGYYSRLCEAEADVVMVGDGVAGPDIIPPNEYWHFSGEYTKDILASIDRPVALHICGDATEILKKMADTGASGLSIEEKVDPSVAVSVVGNRVALIGNVGVVSPLLNGTPEKCTIATRKVMDSGFDVIAPGCGLSALCRDENLEAMVKTVKG